MAEYHLLKVRSTGPSGYETTVELDGRPIRCTRVGWEASVEGFNTATITLAGVLLDIEAGSEVAFIEPSPNEPAS